MKKKNVHSLIYLLGFTKIKITTSLYAKADTETLRDAVERLGK